MTWGSNATDREITCQFCGGKHIDDRDSGPTTHEMVCAKRTWWRRLAQWARSW